MKKLVIFLSVLMLVASAQAKVLKASTKMRISKTFDKALHGWWEVCSGIDITVKYNPTTDRGFIDFGSSCADENEYGEIFVRVYDSDGFQINTFGSYKFESWVGHHIMGTDLTPDERKAAIRIEIDMYDFESKLSLWFEKHTLTCPKGRVSDGEPFGICERVCDDNHIYNSETDKCDYLYDSKGTAELDVDQEELSSPIYTNDSPDPSGEWCQKADGEWYFDNKVKNGKCPKVKVRKDQERESAYSNEPSEKAWENPASATYDAQYNNASGQWECTQPFHHDGYGHCVM